jgi:hypothetical protein
MLKGYQIILWDHWLRACKRLAAKLPDNAYLLPVPRGGYLAMGTLLYLKPSLKVSPAFADHSQMNQVIIDDIYCTGSLRRRWPMQFPFAAIFWRSSASKTSPDFYGEEIKHKKYLVFPWESAEDAVQEIKKLGVKII